MTTTTKKKLVAVNLMNTTGSSPAPKAWAEIPEIKNAMPKTINGERSLQRLDGTDVCVWMVNSGDALWKEHSDYFQVK